MTVTPETLSQIDKMVQYALLKKVKILGIGSVIPFGRASNGELSLKPIQKKEFMKTIFEYSKRNEGVLDVVTEDPLKFLLEYETGNEELKINYNDECVFGGCTAAISSININSDGIITPCSMMEEKILDINNCKDADEIIKKYEKSNVVKKLFDKKYSGKCGKCKLNRICGGCRASAKAYTGSIMGSDLSCWR